MCKWLDARKNEPEDDCEIVFIAKEGITEEKIGVYIKYCRVVLLRRTDIRFDEVQFYIQLPDEPQV